MARSRRGFAADVFDRSERKGFLHRQAAPEGQSAPVLPVERGDVHDLGLEGVETAQAHPDQIVEELVHVAAGVEEDGLAGLRDNLEHPPQDTGPGIPARSDSPSADRAAGPNRRRNRRRRCRGAGLPAPGRCCSRRSPRRSSRTKAGWSMKSAYRFSRPRSVQARSNSEKPRQKSRKRVRAAAQLVRDVGEETRIQRIGEGVAPQRRGGQNRAARRCRCPCPPSGPRRRRRRRDGGPRRDPRRSRCRCPARRCGCRPPPASLPCRDGPSACPPLPW